MLTLHNRCGCILQVPRLPPHRKTLRLLKGRPRLGMVVILSKVGEVLRRDGKVVLHPADGVLNKVVGKVVLQDGDLKDGSRVPQVDMVVARRWEDQVRPASLFQLPSFLCN